MMRTRSQYSKACYSSTTHPYVLCVVDMQTGFRASTNPTTQRRILQLIKQGMNDGALIVFAHYHDYGHTCIMLTHPTDNYPHVINCFANNDDKSHAFMDIITKKVLSYYRIVVVGVNTSACVASTVEGLIEKHSSTVEICVDRKGCYDSSPDNQEDAYKYMESIGAIIL